MADIKVIKGGLLTTIQDRGRIGYQKFGMPVAGAMDEFSLRIGNILLKNKEFEGALEITMIGAELMFNVNTAIAITGADLSPKINNKEVDMWKVLRVNIGDVLSFGKIKSGSRSYICFLGGIDVTEVMGSKSTYIKANVGGLNGKALKAEDELNLLKNNIDLDKVVDRNIKDEFKPIYSNNINVRVVMGPQEDYFSDSGIETLLSSEYEITNEADRMGYRLMGKKIEHVKGADIVSDGIVLGAVQVPAHGMPIIMMADRQTTGGYAKIATVISQDISLLAQGKSKDKIKFIRVSLQEAANLLKEYENRIERIKNSIERVKKEIIKSKRYYINVSGESYNVLVEEYK
ncbi:5-oxoprolinase/urea amidolyase family protein [Clostridium rectalis]|uniref:5-oxoprolinase/urea amidolyase family protein n=1 Tax=Clostridium rectalis TaxID=2040295 RepID=UPI000F633228